MTVIDKGSELSMLHHWCDGQYRRWASGKNVAQIQKKSCENTVENITMVLGKQNQRCIKEILTKQSLFAPHTRPT
jgi:hypothetical protein